jgi:phosphoenolpyruvate carboxykinase (ATP)
MNIFKAAAKQLYETARQEGRLIEGRPLEDLKEIALRQEGVIQTHIGSVAADSEPMSRSAPHTRNSVDHPFGDEEAQLADQMVESLKKERLISLDTYIGDGRDGVSARFLVPEQYAQIAYGVKLLFNHPPLVLDNPTYTIIYYTDEAFERNRAKKLVDKDISIRLMLGDKRGDQVKICHNTIYLGEGKKGIFQFEDWRIKAIDKTGIFLHAGARRDSLWCMIRKPPGWN